MAEQKKARPQWVQEYMDSIPNKVAQPISPNMQRKMNGTAPEVEKNGRLQTK